MQVPLILRARTAPTLRACAGKARIDGITLIEVLVAASIAAIGFAGTWVGLGQCIQIADAHRETIGATQCLMQRVEQLRSAGWGSITTASGIENQVLNIPLSNADSLPNLQEQITVYPYPTLVPAPTPIVVTRNTAGVEQIVSQPPQGFDLRGILAVRADLQLTWQSHLGGRQRVRQISTVVALGGLLN